jgi:hypothetical protein
MKFKLLKYVNNIFGGGGSSAIVSVGAFYVWPKTTRLLPMWPREAKRLDTPGLDTRLTDGGEVVSFTYRPRFTPTHIFWYSFLL